LENSEPLEDVDRPAGVERSEGRLSVFRSIRSYCITGPKEEQTPD
jgi:hypothetical protein